MEPTRQRVFVAGATGYLGEFLVSEFLRRDHEVVALSRSAEGAQRLSSSGAIAVVAEATDPSSLEGHFDGVDVVVSALGITRQKDGLTYDDVDYQANLNLLRAAEQAGVAQFVYVSVFRGEELTETAMVGAKERFVQRLNRSTIRSLVVRPTGFFSDMEEFLKMARSGRVWIFGKGEQRLNPIDGADLATFIADAVESATTETGTDASATELPVGGPDEFTMREVGELAFQSIDRPPRLSSVPMWAVSCAERLLPRVTPLSVYGPLQLFLAASHMSMVAPRFGTRRLADHYTALAAQPEANADSPS